MPSPAEILEEILNDVQAALEGRAIPNDEIYHRVEFVSRCVGNRAGTRLLMACMLAKIVQPNVDPRQPYTEIGGERCFSGRTYDEAYLTTFINRHQLPCNSTTAFLTPALRNMDRPLTTDVVIIGKPRRVYSDALQVLDDVTNGNVSAAAVLADIIRNLVNLRNEKRARMESLLAALAPADLALPLPAERIVTLISQHLACKNSSRLPVLVIAAAYAAAKERLREFAAPLESHYGADEQTGAAGDVEIYLLEEGHMVTAYEMKSMRVTMNDIDRAVTKMLSHEQQLDNYIFITTEPIDEAVTEYAASFYERLGAEIAVLGCIGFLRHYLHLFYRLRLRFLDEYQTLVLAEPESAVSQPLKEAFLILRQTAISDE